MSKYNTKGYDSEVMDIDGEKRTVKAVVARFNNVDLDNDIIVPEAVTKTIRERGPQGSKQVWALIDHKADLKHAIGKPSELYVEGDMLIAVTPIIETEAGEDIIKLYEAGIINEHSIGFSTIKSTMRDDVRVIQELKLYEYSCVVWGANPETPTLGIKGEFKETPETLVKRLEKLSAAFKNGTFTDETFGLMEIEIKQIQAKILELSTQPAIIAVEPQVKNDALVELFRNTNINLKNLLQNGSK